MVAAAERQGAQDRQDTTDNRYTYKEFCEIYERSDADLKAGRVVTFTDKEMDAMDDMEQADLIAFLKKKRKEAGY